MQSLNFPEYTFKIRETEKNPQIFDPFRRKYVALTPEEWVRQHLVHYLIHEKGVPRSLISVEKSIRVNRLAKRMDAVVFSRQGTPLMLIECKAPSVQVSQATFDQAARYNLSLNVNYLLISNGIEHFCCRMDHAGKKYEFLQGIPDYDALQ